MKMKRTRLTTKARFLTLTLLVALAVPGALSRAGEWPSWRGPAGDGTSTETGLVSSWSRHGENLIWKADFIGRSTPVVFDGRACVIGRIGEDVHRQERVACFEAGSGKLLWEDRFNVYHTTVPYNRVGWASLAADPETGYVFAHGVAGQLIAYDRKGKKAWAHYLTEKFGRYSGYGGRTQTPIVVDDQLIISYVASGWGPTAPLRHRYYSFDKRSGELLWISTPGTMPYDFNTQSVPVVADLNGQRVIVTGNADGWLYALEAYTGDKVWGFQLSKRGLNSTALVHGDKVFISHSEENLDEATMGRLVCIDGTGRGDVTKTHEVWRINELSAGFPSPTYQDGRLYVVDNSANLMAIDAETGVALWTHSIGTVGKGSPVLADGKLFVTEVNGRFHIIEPGKEGATLLDMEELEVPGGRYAEIYGSPAIAYGRIYFTTEAGVYCIGDKSKPVVVAAAARPAVPAAGKGKAKKIQVVPAEVLMAPGDSASFHVRAFDGKGRPLGEQTATWSLSGLKGAISEDGQFRADGGMDVQAGLVTAKVGEITAEAPVRVIGGLPWTENFESFEIGKWPLHWIGAAQKFVVAQKGDGKALMKAPRARGLNRSALYMGPNQMTNYTIEADVMGTKEGRRVADVGLIAGGYTLDLQGAHQKLEVRSWASERRMADTVEYAWEPDTWYRLKFQVRTTKQEALVRGKVWPVSEDEPDDWTISVTDPHPIAMGSPGLVAYTPVTVYYDNIKVTGNN